MVLEEEEAADMGMDEKLAAAIKNLWTHPPIQAAFARSSEFQLHDSAK